MDPLKKQKVIMGVMVAASFLFMIFGESRWTHTVVPALLVGLLYFPVRKYEELREKENEERKRRARQEDLEFLLEKHPWMRK